MLPNNSRTNNIGDVGNTSNRDDGSNKAQLSKQDDFLNIFEFNNNADSLDQNAKSGVNGEGTENSRADIDGGILDYTRSNESNITAASNENFNDLNKLLTNTVGNSEYLDMPLPIIFNNNNHFSYDNDVKGNNDFDTNSLLSYTTNNSYMTNNTMTNSISNAGKGKKYSRLGSVKSYRSTAGESMDDEVIRERKKKIHNNVEKKRRELIKNKIQELNELLPLSVIKIVNANDINENLMQNGKSRSELVDPFSIENKDVKVRKRDILCGSLLYINFLNRIVEKVSKRTSQYDDLYTKLVERINRSKQRGGVDTGSNTYQAQNVAMQKHSIENASNSSNSNRYERQNPVTKGVEAKPINPRAHDDIHGMDDFSIFLNSIHDMETQPNINSSSQNPANNSVHNSVKFDQFDNMFNMSSSLDDTFKNLLQQPNNGNSNNKESSATNFNDPFSNWLNM